MEFIVTVLYLMCMFLIWLDQKLMDNVKEIEEKIMYLESELNYLNKDVKRMRNQGVKDE